MSISTNKRRLAFCGAALCIVLLIGLILVDAWYVPPLRGVEVRVFDVGQGDAVLIRTADAALLIDAGPNAAEEALCADLAALGVKALDAVIFTHPDEDHIGGGDLLLERFAVGTVWLAPALSEESSFDRLLAAVSRSGAEVRVGTVGARFSLGGLDVTMLAPAAAYAEANNASIVTRVDYGETSMLFMGDAEAEAETALLADPSALRADFLKLGHHGADTSTSDALLDAVQPTFAAISCGKSNNYGHPARRVVDALTARGIAIGRTDREGTLVYHSDGTSLWRE